MKKNYSYLYYSLIILFAIWAIVVRFHKITIIGIQGDDVFYYWDMAYNWATGSEHITFHYRPLTHWLYSLSMNVFGINGYAIKFLNSSINLISGLLIYFIAKRITKDTLTSILTPMIYISLPYVIEESRSELTHILTTFFYLLSFLSFTLFYNNRYEEENSLKKLYLILSGFTLGCATHIHPDIGTLGLPFVSIIFITNYKIFRFSEDFKNLFKKSFIKDAFLFTASYFSIFLIFIIKFGFLNVVKNLKKGFSHQQSPDLVRTPLETISRIFDGLFSYTEASLSSYGAALYLILVFYFLLRHTYLKKKINILLFMIFSFPIFHILTCLILVQRKYILRLAHPSVPFIIIFILYATHLLLKDFKLSRFRKKALLLISALLVYTSGTKLYDPEIYETSIYSQVTKSLKANQLDKSNTLITPSLFHWYRKGFKYELYLGKKAVYLSDFRHGKWKFKNNIEDNLKAIINHYKVKTIVILKNDKNIRKDLKDHIDSSVFFHEVYNISQSDYSLKWEYQTLRDFVLKVGATKIDESEKFEIYVLKGEI